MTTILSSRTSVALPFPFLSIPFALLAISFRIRCIFLRDPHRKSVFSVRSCASSITTTSYCSKRLRPASEPDFSLDSFASSLTSALVPYETHLINTPSVRNRTPVDRLVMSSKRTVYPTSSPTATPISAPTRFASAIAGSRLG